MSCDRCPIQGNIVCHLDHCGLCWAETEADMLAGCGKPSERDMDRAELIHRTKAEGDD